jgi:capsid assembly protease
MHPTDTPQCFTSFMGQWLVEAKWMKSAISAINAGMYPQNQGVQAEAGYRVDNGLAIINLAGPMMKKVPEKFDGASTIDLRRQFRAANADPEIKEILMIVESPGGTVSGTQEFAADIRASTKPVTAYINDIGASAGYWAASQAGAIYANAMAEVGSIGVVAVVHDTSAAFEREGVRVIVVSTGDMKGAFTDGTPVTDAMLADLQERVDYLNSIFLDSVSSGRNMPMDQLKAIATGATFNAPKALELGLIDGVQTLDTVISTLQERISLSQRQERSNALSARIKR